MPPMAMASAAAAASSVSKTAASSILLQRGLPIVSNSAHNMYAPTAKWIMGTAASVVGMIHVGGVTRLTQSGLSMTDWSPLGSLPPMTNEAWEAEFARYKMFPEWQQRKQMTLSDFQFIYAWEYGHRMLGRTVGLIFAVPWVYFSVRGKIPSGYQKRMVGLLCMGGTQGLVGWWMVKSGLGDDRRDEKHEIRVKPFRLAAHLSMAVATYGALLWTGLNIFNLPHHTEAKQKELVRQVAALGKDAIRHGSRLRGGAIMLTGLTAGTIVSGAFVAGNDAGRAYNTYPKMDGQWIPSGMWDLTPMSRNIYENTTTVQFNHRLLGTATAATAVSLLGFGLTRQPSSLLTPQVRNGLFAIGIASVGQMSLGIATLLTYVPLGLAAAHQIGSIVVFTSGVYLVHSLRYVKPSMVRQATAIMGKSTPSGDKAVKMAETMVKKSVPSP